MPKFRARLLALFAMALGAVAMMAPAAQGATPAPGYTQFKGCPTTAEVPYIAACMRAVVKSGHFKMGNKNVPITNPIEITGGVNNEFGGFAANSEGGMKAVKQQVPGGIIGLTGLDWLVNFLSLEGLKLYAVTELAGQPKIGATLAMPIKVHLINPVLGNNCYVGSFTNPIKLELIDGTTNPPPPNQPITGVSPEFIFDETTGIIKFANGTLVDNSFAAPGASGCVLTLFGFIPISINGLVNSTSGLPAPAGTNETVQKVDVEAAPVERVYP